MKKDDKLFRTLNLLTGMISLVVGGIINYYGFNPIASQLMIVSSLLILSNGKAKR